MRAHSGAPRVDLCQGTVTRSASMIFSNSSPAWYAAYSHAASGCFVAFITCTPKGTLRITRPALPVGTGATPFSKGASAKSCTTALVVMNMAIRPCWKPAPVPSSRFSSGLMETRCLMVRSAWYWMESRESLVSRRVFCTALSHRSPPMGQMKASCTSRLAQNQSMAHTFCSPLVATSWRERSRKESQVQRPSRSYWSGVFRPRCWRRERLK